MFDLRKRHVFGNVMICGDVVDPELNIEVNGRIAKGMEEHLRSRFFQKASDRFYFVEDDSTDFLCIRFIGDADGQLHAEAIGATEVDNGLGKHIGIR